MKGMVAKMQSLKEFLLERYFRISLDKIEDIRVIIYVTDSEIEIRDDYLSCLCNDTLSCSFASFLVVDHEEEYDENGKTTKINVFVEYAQEV